MISCSNCACARLVRSKLNCETFQTLLSWDIWRLRAATTRGTQEKSPRFEGFLFLAQWNRVRLPGQARRPIPQPSAALAITTAHGGTRQNTSATNATSAAARSRGATIVSVQTG